METHTSNVSVQGHLTYLDWHSESNGLAVLLNGLRRIFEGRQIKLPLYESQDSAQQWQDFVRSLHIPGYFEIPMTVLNTFESCDDDELLHTRLSQIFSRGQYTLVNNASGSGKTSLLFEGLSREWGIYFVGAAERWIIGSRDYWQTTQRLFRHTDGVHIAKDPAARLEILKIPLMVRLLAFEVFAESVDISSATDEDRKLWLLAQACGRYYFDEHLSDQFLIAVESLLPFKGKDVSAEIDRTIAHIRVLTKDPSFHLYCVLDQAHAIQYESGDIDNATFQREISRSWGKISLAHCHRFWHCRFLS